MNRVKPVLTRFATMFLALICVIGMGTPVFAENPNKIPTTPPVSFSIGGFDTSTQAEGIQIDAYQIISVNVDGNNQAANPLYIWDSSVAGWMTNENNEAAYGTYVNTLDKGTDDEVNYVSDAFTPIATEVSETVVNQEEATKFYEELAAAIREDESVFLNVTKTQKTYGDIDKASGEVTFGDEKTGMPLGVYLVIVTGGVKTYQPTVVTLLPTYNGSNWEISSVVGIADGYNIKSTDPAITKTVADDNKTVEVGEKINYTLDITVPDYPIDSVNRYFTVEDKMPDGIEYDNGTGVVIKYTDSNGVERAVEHTDDTYYSIAQVDVNNAKKGFMITFTDQYFAKYGDVEKLSITYRGTVVKAAFENNPDKLENTATLTYSTNPYIDTEIDPLFNLGVLKSVSASVRVFSYRIQINKVNKEGTPLAGALFQIFTKTEEGISKEPLKFTGENGNYILAPTTETSTPTPSSSPIIPTPLIKTSLQVSDVTGTEGNETGGTLLIKGLDVGTYVIKEVVAPKDYVLPDGQLEVTITDNNLDGSIDDPVTVTKTGSFELYTGHEVVSGGETADGIYITNTGAGTGISSNPEINPDPVFKNTVTIDVLNTSSDEADFTLPSTGGMGTLIFTVGGLFVMAGAVVLAVVMYKKKNA